MNKRDVFLFLAVFLCIGYLSLILFYRNHLLAGLCESDGLGANATANLNESITFEPFCAVPCHDLVCRKTVIIHIHKQKISDLLFFQVCSCNGDDLVDMLPMPLFLYLAGGS